MDFLSGLLAFAVVMILMSTIVSGVMELLVRLLALRASVLETMISRFIKNELEGHLDRIVKDYAGADAAAALGDARAAAPEGLVDRLTFNPLHAGGGKDETQKASSGKQSWFGQVLANRNRVEILTAWAFLQRLARTEYGRAILALGEARALDVLTDLSRTYERYASAAQEAFRKKTAAWSMAIAVILGVAMNVNAPVLLNHLVTDASASTSLIAMAPEAFAANEAAAARLSEALRQATDGADGGEEVAQEGARALEADIRLVRAAAEGLRLPILFNAYPYVEPGHEWPELWILRAPLWFIGALLGGVLIGLGGPFWYRVFSGLSRATALLREVTGASRETAVNPSDERATIVGDLDKEFGTPRMVESFRIAAGLSGVIDRDGFPPCG